MVYHHVCSAVRFWFHYDNKETKNMNEILKWKMEKAVISLCLGDECLLQEEFNKTSLLRYKKYARPVNPMFCVCNFRTMIPTGWHSTRAWTTRVSTPASSTSTTSSRISIRSYNLLSLNVNRYRRSEMFQSLRS